MAQYSPDPFVGDCDNKPNDIECIKKRNTLRFILIVLSIICTIGFINFLTGKMKKEHEFRLILVIVLIAVAIWAYKKYIKK